MGGAAAVDGGAIEVAGVALAADVPECPALVRRGAVSGRDGCIRPEYGHIAESRSVSSGLAQLVVGVWWGSPFIDVGVCLDLVPNSVLWGPLRAAVSPVYK